MLCFLSESVPSLENLTQLGAAGLMGVMWLWERNTSRAREKQIDESHARIMSDRLELDQLVDVVRKNTEAMTRLASLIQEGAGR